MRKLISLIKYYRRFGLRGVLFYLKVIYGNAKNIYFSHRNYKLPILLRRHSTDVSAFEQIIFLENNKLYIDFTPDIILDCGANIGLTTVYFKNKYPAARIFAVEIEGSNFDILRKNTEGYENIVTYHNAIWNKEVNLAISDNGNGEWGFSGKELDTDSRDDSVKGITISSIIKEHSLKSIDVLKIDIEGGEKYLFDSDYEDWISFVKILIIEFHDRVFPYSSNPFFKAISKYDFLLSQQGDILVFQFK